MNKARKATLVVAEVGSVHDGSFGNAERLIEVAAETGVDAVKFQTHIASAETLRDAPTPPYFTDEPRYEYFERTAFSRDQWRRLRAACRDANVEFISSPFSQEAVALLEEVGVDRFKVASGEVTNVPLLDAIGKTGRPVLLSSGMSSWEELDAAVETLTSYHDDVVVLQCTSAYPCPPERVGLNVLAELRERYGLRAGFSDHTPDNYAAFAAVTLGAVAVEKHFTLSRFMYGSDAANAAEPAQFADLVRGIRSIETTIANPVDKDDVEPFREMKRIFEKSVVSTANIKEGTILTAGVVGIKKPGTGIPASRYPDVIGATAARDIDADRVLSADDLLGFSK